MIKFSWQFLVQLVLFLGQNIADAIQRLIDILKNRYWTIFQREGKLLSYTWGPWWLSHERSYYNPGQAGKQVWLYQYWNWYELMNHGRHKLQLLTLTYFIYITFHSPNFGVQVDIAIVYHSWGIQTVLGAWSSCKQEPVSRFHTDQKGKPPHCFYNTSLQTHSETVFGVDFRSLNTFSGGIWSTRECSTILRH